jgi:hypothetical protein
MINNKSSFNTYLNKVKDSNVKNHLIQEVKTGNRQIILESRQDYRNYFNYLIETKQLDVSKLKLQEEIMLVKYPEMFYENLFSKIGNRIGKAVDDLKNSKAGQMVSGAIKGAKEFVKDTAKSTVSTAREAVTNLKKMPSAISAGFSKTWAKVKSITSKMWQQVFEKIKPLIDPMVVKIKAILKEPWVRIFLAFVSIGIGIIMKLMSPISVIVAIVKGFWKDKWPNQIGDKVKIIAESIKEIKNRNQKIDMNKVEKQSEIEMLKKQKEDKKNEKNKTLMKESKENNDKLYSYNELYEYKDFYAEARSFLDAEISVYNENNYIFNEITAENLPLEDDYRIKNAIENKHNFIFLKNYPINKNKYNLVIDLKKDRIGCFSPSGEIDGNASMAFAKLFNDSPKLDSEEMYKWRKGEWRLIKDAIEKKSSGSSDATDSPKKTINNKKGNVADVNMSGGDGGRKGSGGSGSSGSTNKSKIQQTNAVADSTTGDMSQKGGDQTVNITNNMGDLGAGLNAVAAAIASGKTASGSTPPVASNPSFITWFWSPDALRLYSAILLLLLIALLIYYFLNFIHGASAAGSEVASQVIQQTVSNVKEQKATQIIQQLTKAANNSGKIVQSAVETIGNGNLTQINNFDFSGLSPEQIEAVLKNTQGFKKVTEGIDWTKLEIPNDAKEYIAAGLKANNEMA